MHIPPLLFIILFCAAAISCILLVERIYSYNIHIHNHKKVLQ